MLLILSSCGCSSTTENIGQNTDVTVTSVNRSLDIHYGGKLRLSGGYVKMQSSDIQVKELSRSGDRFSFLTDSSPIEVSIHKSADSPVVSFFFSPNGNQSNSGMDFLGLFFEQIPDYEQGVTIWRYKPWNSWSKPIRIENIADMEDDDVQFFYWRYSDGVYGAAIPLCGEGYRTHAGTAGRVVRREIGQLL